MTSHPFLAAALAVAALPAVAQETRDMDAHEHGVSTVQVAVEDGTVTIDLHAPGMDVVGFEHEPASPADMQRVSDAVLRLARPSEVVAPGAAAGCRVVEVRARRQGEDHGAHGDEATHDDHGDKAHAEEAGGGHSEFHARYVFACEDADALAEISFPFFERFEGAREIEAEYVTAAGAGAAELTAGSATLSLD